MEIRAKTGQQTMDKIQTGRRPRWLGHVIRTDHQQALYCEVYQNTRKDQVDQEQTEGAQ